MDEDALARVGVATNRLVALAKEKRAAERDGRGSTGVRDLPPTRAWPVALDVHQGIYYIRRD